MDLSRYFSRDYAEARRRFRDLCDSRGLLITTFDHPERGPDGGALATDVARAGPADAETILLVVSGTHGVEGFGGSGCQLGLLDNDVFDRLAPGAAVVLVHAINPYGFAWQQRLTEGHVDLNRNFVDFAKPLPQNPDYDYLDPYLIPRELSGPVREAADAKIKEYIAEKGQMAFQTALGRGQYTHPDGLFFGGGEPSWSRLTHEAIAAQFLGGAKRVALIDLHTGLGPYGYGEVLCFHAAGSAAQQRARAWYGDAMTEPRAGGSVSSDLDGTTYDGYERLLAGKDYTLVALEFGTRPFLVGFEALRAEGWRRRYGQRTGPEAERIRAQSRHFFHVDKEDWQEMVLFRAGQVVRQVLRGLSAP
ncbi:MAG TPA: M14 family metallopeptidase [Alphaproteobacteria bacterium]|jgi:hypothetical protein|nr:M14 family metallopeptidase [Alphaproteobacteria bacterium]